MEELTRIKTDLTATIAAIEALANVIGMEARDSADRAADYEEKKNSYLIELYEEEIQFGFKRTEAQRQALYRDRFREERRRMLLSREELQSSRDLLKGLQAKLNALQTLARLSELEFKIQE